MKMITKLIEGEAYFAGPDEYVIGENASIEDIIQFAILQSGPDKQNAIETIRDLLRDM